VLRKHRDLRCAPTSGQLTEGVVIRLLTSSSTHTHGIKVMLVGGKVGRVQAIVK